MIYDMTQLYNRLKAIDYKQFYEIEADFYRCFYSDPEIAAIPLINAFLTVSGWFGTSERSGVWTFYEAADPDSIQKAVGYLKQTGESELAAIIEKGIHDYQDPKYAENYDYPEEWITESEEIDAWIRAHDDWLCHWLYDLLLRNENTIIAL